MLSALGRCVRFALLAGAPMVVAAGGVLADGALARPASLAVGSSASAAAVSHGALKRCATFTINEVAHGKLVRRNGKVVMVKRTRCVTVSAAACMVVWIKERKHGRVVIRQHNPVYITKVMCPPAGMTPPVAPPTTPSSPPQTPAGLGNAAVAVYDVTAQGGTYQPLDEDFPSQQYVPIESFTKHGYLVRLLTPFPGIGGQEAQDELGLWLGSLTGSALPTAGTLQFATNTLMFSAANFGDRTIYQNLPYPYDLGQIAVKDNMLLGEDTLSDIEKVTPPYGMQPIYFVDRSGAVPGQIKGVTTGAVLLQFPSASDTSSFTGVVVLQGSASLAIGAPSNGEYGPFGVAASLTGKLISPPGGQPIYLPPPLPTIPRPPGCRTELHLVPGISDGTLGEQETVVCS